MAVDSSKAAIGRLVQQPVAELAWSLWISMRGTLVLLEAARSTGGELCLLWRTSSG